MKLYKQLGEAPGQRWSPARPRGKYEEVFIGGEGRGGMADFLNANEAEIALRQSPLLGPPFEAIHDMDDHGQPVEEPSFEMVRQSNTPEMQAKAREIMAPIDRSISIDEEWERLPLSRKLHFAADAMEAARAQLNGGKS